MEQPEIPGLQINREHGKVIHATLPTITDSSPVVCQFWTRHDPIPEVLLGLCLVWERPLEIMLINKIFLNSRDLITQLSEVPVFTYVVAPKPYLQEAERQGATFGRIVVHVEKNTERLAYISHTNRGHYQVVCKGKRVEEYMARHSLSSRVTA